MHRFPFYLGALVHLVAGISFVASSHRQGDKLVLGGNGEGCGPKFIFKSGTKRHKEFFILNECKEDRHQSASRPVVKLVPVFRPPKQHSKHHHKYHHHYQRTGHAEPHFESHRQTSSKYHVPAFESNQRPPWLPPTYEPIMQRYLASNLRPYFQPASH